ncbi:adenylate/guanylate cyclase domain-containing protein [Rhodococcus oryzae]|uniref:Adenylate/guanylate cyclase domain-containing protein n=1 Tax=Rhodococcus oryzae TaxID=2571143 RepID=A0ABY2RND6_9NOCA|nr:adenylate/guanylate cyclase domain-containing protein [Rhodococcus oryzae]TJZ79991.1 adenylate/guanylate cyclase domain-containing protein [Rhodococcus oryzae]
MDPPGTRYVERDGHALAYQVVGEGGADVDVVLFLEIGLHPDLMWTDPHIHYVFERATTFCRMVYFQRRGFGLSDPVDHVPTLEQQADDVLAVMDAVGMQRATLVGIGSTCGALALIAARTPDRVTGMVFQQPFVEGALRGGVDLPRGWTVEARDRFVDGWRTVYDNWGSGGVIAMWDPTQDSPFNRRLMALLERCSATPATARAHLEWLFRIDYFEVLASIQCGTRVLHSARSAVPLAVSRHIAAAIPHGTLHVLPPLPPGTSMGQAWIEVLDHIEEVATGVHRPVDAERYLASVMFTDIAGSTETLARIGDSPYRDLRATHERQVRIEVELAGGRLVNVAGDGTLSVFDGPAAAVRCAHLVCRQAEDLGLGVRAGVHTGEIEGIGTELTGITVHIGARIGAAAGPGEVLVSRAVRDQVVGSGLSFVDHGTHELKGVPGRWRLYALTATDAPAECEPSTVSQKTLGLTMLDRAVLRMARRAPHVLRAAAEMANARQRRLSRRPD